jgi:hypothetical protein
MTRQVFIAVGAALLAIGGSSVVAILVWLTANTVHGTLSYIYDTRTEVLLFLLPALMLMVAIVGAVFVSTALSTPPKDERNANNLHPHTHFHA